MNKTFGRLTESEVKFILEENSCPLCGSEGFYHGPEGWWYTWDKEQDWMHDETSFFTKEDLNRLEIIGEIQ